MSAASHVYRSIAYGVEALEPGITLPRHRHTHGYATVVLAGSFVEASFAGRFTVAPGDVLLRIHRLFSKPLARVNRAVDPAESTAYKPERTPASTITAHELQEQSRRHSGRI